MTELGGKQPVSAVRQCLKRLFRVVPAIILLSHICLAQSPKQHSDDAQKAQKHSDKVAPANPSIPDATSKPLDTHNSQAPDRNEILKVLSDGLLALFTLALVVVSLLQWLVLRKHEEWMEKHDAKLAQLAQAANNNAQALIDSERPWVVVRPYIPSPQFFPLWEKGDPIPQGDMGTWPISHLFPAQVKNVGRTPARIESYALDYVRTQIHPSELPDEPAYHNVVTQDILIVPDDEMAVTTALAPERGTLTKAQLAEIEKRREFLFAYGFVKYRHGDGSGPEYETRFGYIYDVSPTYAVMKEGKIEELSFQKATFNRGGKPAYNKAR
jgi:hypothetical protein